MVLAAVLRQVRWDSVLEGGVGIVVYVCVCLCAEVLHLVSSIGSRGIERGRRHLDQLGLGGARDHNVLELELAAVLVGLLFEVLLQALTVFDPKLAKLGRDAAAGGRGAGGRGGTSNSEARPAG